MAIVLYRNTTVEWARKYNLLNSEGGTGYVGSNIQVDKLAIAARLLDEVEQSAVV
jgi:hypothetical protein